MQPLSALQRIAHIRDFFAATEPEKRKAPLLALLEESPLPTPQDSPEFWLALEYQFNSLFVGPGPVSAPPYASVYLETDQLLMGHSTLRVRALLHSLGLRVPCEEQNPDDFLPYELDLYLALHQDPAASTPEHRWFLYEHLPQWLALFLRQARAHATHPALLQVFTLLENSVISKSEGPLPTSDREPSLHTT